MTYFKLHRLKKLICFVILRVCEKKGFFCLGKRLDKVVFYSIQVGIAIANSLLGWWDTYVKFPSYSIGSMCGIPELVLRICWKPAVADETISPADEFLQ